MELLIPQITGEIDAKLVPHERVQQRTAEQQVHQICEETIEMVKDITSTRWQQWTVEQIMDVFGNRRGGRLDPQVRMHQLSDEQL